MPAFHLAGDSPERIIRDEMHELAVTESILDIVKRHAKEAKAEKILRIHLVIGELSSIVDDSVQFYFDYLAEDSIAKGAELVFRRVPVTLRCRACAHTWEPDSADWLCPSCNQVGPAIVAGREFYVDSIEVE